MRECFLLPYVTPRMVPLCSSRQLAAGQKSDGTPRWSRQLQPEPRKRHFNALLEEIGGGPALFGRMLTCAVSVLPPGPVRVSASKRLYNAQSKTGRQGTAQRQLVH